MFKVGEQAYNLKYLEKITAFLNTEKIDVNLYICYEHTEILNKFLKNIPLCA